MWTRSVVAALVVDDFAIVGKAAGLGKFDRALEVAPTWTSIRARRKALGP